ncbi:MAG TPA: sugar ABC transporter permease [Candidatus Limnocylindria bacterium]|jgi:multiple sugar transport system permease protein|nr:sugar ABC transporter permease [Candidatus Limnocylindria bacterium]
MTGATQALASAPIRATLWQRRGVRRATTFYLFLSPWIVGFVALTLVPLALALLMSFTDYDGFNLAGLHFLGLENYLRALGDPDAQHALQRTLILMVLVVPAGVALQLALALMLNQRIRFSGVFRTLFYLPYVIPVVGGAWIWKLFTDPNGGLLNALVGIVQPDTYVRWLVEYPTAVLAVFVIWAAAGGGMVVFLAGLQGIPAEYREAAMIDGANRWQVTRFITLPLLSPVIFFQLVVGIIAALQILQQPILLTPGITGLSPGTVPPRDNYVFVGHAYTSIFVNHLFGYGAALLWILFVVVLVLTLLLFRTSRRWVFYGVEQ